MDSLILQRDKDCPRESGNFQSYLVFLSGNGCTYTAKQIGVFLTRIEQLWITEYAKCFNYNKDKLYGYVWRRNSKPDLWSLLITGLAWNTRIKGMALCANVMRVFQSQMVDATKNNWKNWKVRYCIPLSIDWEATNV